MTQPPGTTNPVQDQESETDHWAVNIAGHPVRKDSTEFVHSKAALTTMATSVSDLLYGQPPYDDHHGGGLWLKDAQGWFMVRNIAGIEWSAQFCADPAKVDEIRRNAQRLYAGFPGAAQELGIQELLDTPITDPAGISQWTDSICNASVPLPPPAHTGTLPTAGGVHHYPTPITDIEYFKRDDFQLWVTDAQGNPAAVAPMKPRNSGDGRVHVLYATPGSDLDGEVQASEADGEPLVLPDTHSLAQQAFAQQAQVPAPRTPAGS
jgi:Family of unknown function (DUF6424)